MLRVTIELLPHGDESSKRTLGIVNIANDGTGTEETGNYTVELTKEPPIARRRGVWKRGVVKGFPRLVLGPYDLLHWALMATIGTRNTRAIRRSMAAVQADGAGEIC